MQNRQMSILNKDTAKAKTQQNIGNYKDQHTQQKTDEDKGEQTNLNMKMKGRITRTNAQNHSGSKRTKTGGAQFYDSRYKAEVIYSCSNECF